MVDIEGTALGSDSMPDYFGTVLDIFEWLWRVWRDRHIITRGTHPGAEEAGAAF